MDLYRLELSTSIAGRAVFPVLTAHIVVCVILLLFCSRRWVKEATEKEIVVLSNVKIGVGDDQLLSRHF